MHFQIAYTTYLSREYSKTVFEYSRTLINANAFITANPADLTRREPVYSKYLNSDAHIFNIYNHYNNYYYHCSQHVVFQFVF